MRMIRDSAYRTTATIASDISRTLMPCHVSATYRFTVTLRAIVSAASACACHREILKFKAAIHQCQHESE